MAYQGPPLAVPDIQDAIHPMAPNALTDLLAYARAQSFQLQAQTAALADRAIHDRLDNIVTRLDNQVAAIAEIQGQLDQIVMTDEDDEIGGVNLLQGTQEELAATIQRRLMDQAQGPFSANSKAELLANLTDEELTNALERHALRYEPGDGARMLIDGMQRRLDSAAETNAGKERQMDKARAQKQGKASHSRTSGDLDTAEHTDVALHMPGVLLPPSETHPAAFVGDQPGRKIMPIPKRTNRKKHDDNQRHRQASEVSDTAVSEAVAVQKHKGSRMRRSDKGPLLEPQTSTKQLKSMDKAKDPNDQGGTAKRVITRAKSLVPSDNPAAAKAAQSATPSSDPSTDKSADVDQGRLWYYHRECVRRLKRSERPQAGYDWLCPECRPLSSDEMDLRDSDDVPSDEDEGDWQPSLLAQMDAEQSSVKGRLRSMDVPSMASNGMP